MSIKNEHKNNRFSENYLGKNFAKLILNVLAITVLVFVFMSTTKVGGFMTECYAAVNTGKFLDNLYIDGTDGLEIYEETTEVDVVSGTVSSTYVIKNSKQGTFRGNQEIGREPHITPNVRRKALGDLLCA